MTCHILHNLCSTLTVTSEYFSLYIGNKQQKISLILKLKGKNHSEIKVGEIFYKFLRT